MKLSEPGPALRHGYPGSTTGFEPDSSLQPRYRGEDIFHNVIGISAAAMLSLWFDRRYPLANIGIALMIVSLVLEMDCLRALRFQLRSIGAQLPLRDSLAARRKRVAEAIASARLAVIPAGVPLAIGVLLYEIDFRKPLPVLAAWFAGLTVVFTLAQFGMERLIRRNLVPLIAGIDREQDKSDSNQPADATAGSSND